MEFTVKTNCRCYDKITDAYVCLMLLVFPLWKGSSGYLNITAAKYGFFLWSALVYIGLMLITAGLCLFTGKYRDTAEKGMTISPTQICILIYALLCCVSAVLSDYGSKVWLGAGRYEGVSTILLYAVIFLLVSCFGKLRKLHLYLIGAVVTINAVIGILQYLGYNPFMLYPKGYTHHDAFTLYANAFLGTLGNIDLLSAFLSLMLPLLYAYYLLNEKTGLMLVPFTAGVFLLLLSGVSAGLVGIGGGLIITFPALANSRQRLAKVLRAGGLSFFSVAVYTCLNVTYENRIIGIHPKFGAPVAVSAVIAAALICLSHFMNRSGIKAEWNEKKAKRIRVICVIAAIAAFLVVVRAYPFSSGALSEMHRLLWGDVDASFGSSRIQIWRQAAGLVPEHIWFGGGPDTLAERIGFTFKRFNEVTGTMIETSIDNAHNDYLNILVNTGVISLLAYLAAIFIAAVRTLRAGLENKTAAVVFVALLCYLIQMLFGFSICIVSPFFWILFGLLDAALWGKRIMR